MLPRDLEPLLAEARLFVPGNVSNARSAAAWCELRSGFRNFRLDRVGEATLRDRFEEEAEGTLRDMLAQYGPAAVKLLDQGNH